MNDLPTLKTIILGDSGVGKTSLLRMYENRPHFNISSVDQTIGLDFLTCTENLASGDTVRLQIWDTAGQERFNAMVQQFVRGAHGIIVAFACDDLDSFRHLSKWYDLICKHYESMAFNDDMSHQSSYTPVGTGLASASSSSSSNVSTLPAKNGPKKVLTPLAVVANKIDLLFPHITESNSSNMFRILDGLQWSDLLKLICRHHVRTQCRLEKEISRDGARLTKGRSSNPRRRSWKKTSLQRTGSRSTPTTAPSAVARTGSRSVPKKERREELPAAPISTTPPSKADVKASRGKKRNSAKRLRRNSLSLAKSAIDHLNPMSKSYTALENTTELLKQANKAPYLENGPADAFDTQFVENTHGSDLVSPRLPRSLYVDKDSEFERRVDCLFGDLEEQFRSQLKAMSDMAVIATSALLKYNVDKPFVTLAEAMVKTRRTELAKLETSTTVGEFSIVDTPTSRGLLNENRWNQSPVGSSGGGTENNPGCCG